MVKPPRPRQHKTDLPPDKVRGRAIVTPVRNGEQLWLFDAPLPEWIQPCKPTLVRKPPAGDQWQHEIKWDGYRVSAYVLDGQATIRTSSRLDWTARFPAIARDIAALPMHSAVIDGEAVVLDEHGRSRFGDLQRALTKGGAHEAVLFVFDLLFYDGLDIREWKLENRRAVLEGLLAGAAHALRFSEALDAPGDRVFELPVPMASKASPQSAKTALIVPTLARLAEDEVHPTRRFCCDRLSAFGGHARHAWCDPCRDR